jgi:hypothetical protein
MTVTISEIAPRRDCGAALPRARRLTGTNNCRSSTNGNRLTKVAKSL